MKKLKTAIWMIAFALFLFGIGVVYAAKQLEIPYGDYEVLSDNATHDEFILAFTGDYRWHVRAVCLQTGVPPPAVGSICNYDGVNFTCPGAQNLSLVEIIQAPPTPTPTFTPTMTASATPTSTFTPQPTFTSTFTATALPTITLTPTRTSTQSSTALPTWTPVLPGAPASADLLATISAANEPFRHPAESRSLLDWIQWLIKQLLNLFEK
jgi:hypothetical protein